MKWFITWDAGYGRMHDIVEADSESEAQDIAYRNWREDAEDAAVYDAEEVTADHVLDNGLEGEFSDDELIDMGLVFNDEDGYWEYED